MHRFKNKMKKISIFFRLQVKLNLNLYPLISLFGCRGLTGHPKIYLKNKRIWVKIYLLWVIFFFYLGENCIAAPKNDSPFYIYDIITKYDCVFTEQMKQHKIPGAALAVVRNDEVIYVKCYGVRNVNFTEPVNEHTLFRLASLSKGISAVLTGMLVESKALAWDAPVINYLHDFQLCDPAATQRLTIRHILSHTSGLPSYAGTELLESNLSYPVLKTNLATVRLSAQPGEQYNYQNVLFSLIGDIIKSVMQTGYEQVIDSYLFKPLGMNDACMGRLKYLGQLNHASAHIMRDSVVVPVKIKQSYYNIPPAAGMNASITDMVQWLKVMLGYRPDIVSPAIREQIFMPYIKTDKESRYFGKWRNLNDTYYGLGWRVFNYAETNLIYHGGYVQGFRSEIAIDPVNRLGIVILMNSESPFADMCIPLFFDLYLGLPNNCTQRTSEICK